MAGLQFNDTTNRAGLIQECERRLNKDVPGNPGISGNTTLLADFTVRLNEWYHKVVTMIFAAQDDWDFDDITQTDYPVAVTNLVAGQQDYTFPLTLGILKIQRVEISYDGSTWRRAIPFDKGESSRPLDASSVASNFTTSVPYYDLLTNSMFLYPVPTANVTAGLKIWFLRSPLEFVSTDTTKQPGIDPAFHWMIAIGACLDYAIAKNLPQKNDLAATLTDYEARLKIYYGRKNEDRDWALKPAFTDYN